MAKFIRSKTYYCGGTSNTKAEYIEQDLFDMCEAKSKKKARNKKEKVSTPRQRDLNNKYSKRYCSLLAKTNFNIGDYFVTLTYQDRYLPDTFEKALKDVYNYIRRIKDASKKRGGQPVKYIYVVEEGSLNGRIHIHLLLNSDCELTREEVEAKWSVKGKKGADPSELMLGYANVKVLQEGRGGIESAIGYMLKGERQVKGRRTYNASHNLKKPMTSNNDSKVSRAKFEQLCLWNPESEAVKEYFERLNPGYDLISVSKTISEESGQVSFTAKLRLKESERKKYKSYPQKRGINHGQKRPGKKKNIKGVQA